MAHKVKCKYCGKQFDIDKEDFEKLGNRYAHKACAIENAGKKSDKELLDDYICKMFNSDFVSPKIQRQIRIYVEDYGYTYSGILGSLTYFYDIQKHDISKANDGIGIVPYVYNQARKYAYDIKQANLKNQNKDISQIIKPKVIEVSILNPERKIEEKKLFDFLDKDEVDTDEF